VHTRWRESIATRDSEHLVIKSGVVLGCALLERDRAGTACKIENELDDCPSTETAQFAQTGGQSTAPRIFLAQPGELGRINDFCCHLCVVLGNGFAAD
jgi:hypothetical protein